MVPLFRILDLLVGLSESALILSARALCTLPSKLGISEVKLSAFRLLLVGRCPKSGLGTGQQIKPITDASLVGGGRAPSPVAPPPINNSPLTEVLMPN